MIIMHHAFNSCGNLRTITFGTGIKHIYDNAFNSCWSLEFIHIPDIESWCQVEIEEFGSPVHNNTEVYLNNELLVEAVIPNGVTRIGQRAFMNFKDLANVVVPDSVKSIGTDAFRGTAWYNNLSDGIITLGKVLYAYKGIMPEDTTISLASDLLSISGYAFNGCGNLMYIDMPSTIESIGEFAFNNCTGLTEIVLPTAITRIEKSTFGYCTGLTSIDIPEGVVSIGEDAFGSCSNLTTLILPVSLTTIKSKAFYNTNISTIYYRGTQEQWETAWYNFGQGKQDLQNATVIYEYEN
jgi:hypothetical protein